MTISLDDVLAIEALENRIRAILPELYADTYEDVLPTPMGSAGLRYDNEGRVAWDQIWSTFCDLAMAGGPPHRGTLLEPASEDEIASDSETYNRNSEEIRRGLTLVTGLPSEPGPLVGWLTLRCESVGMAGWLTRAVVMENVLARQNDATLLLPCGPAFRIQKEIRNVITVVAKTCHYWSRHMSPEKQASIDSLFRQSTTDSRLLQPALRSEADRDHRAYREVLESIRQGISQATQLPCFENRYVGWLGVECRSVRAAIIIMRAMVAENVVSRREGEVVFLPVSMGDHHDRVTKTFTKVWHLSLVRKIL